MNVSENIPAPMQKRSKETANRFVEAAFRLLRDRTYAELSVAELAAEAGRSVGVFYQRFTSKDDFLAILVNCFLEEAIRQREINPPKGDWRESYSMTLNGMCRYVRENLNLWHAALIRSAVDPEFWSQFTKFRERWYQITLAEMTEALGRPPSEQERRRIAISIQIFNSVINNQIINGPGPLRLDSDDFMPELLKVVLNAAELD